MCLRRFFVTDEIPNTEAGYPRQDRKKNVNIRQELNLRSPNEGIQEVLNYGTRKRTRIPYFIDKQSKGKNCLGWPRKMNRYVKDKVTALRHTFAKNKM